VSSRETSPVARCEIEGFIEFDTVWWSQGRLGEVRLHAATSEKKSTLRRLHEIQPLQRRVQPGISVKEAKSNKVLSGKSAVSNGQDRWGYVFQRTRFPFSANATALLFSLTNKNHQTSLLEREATTRNFQCHLSNKSTAKKFSSSNGQQPPSSVCRCHHNHATLSHEHYHARYLDLHGPAGFRGHTNSNTRISSD
jgi:hypothetical protein